MLSPEGLRELIDRKELQARAELYDYELLTPFFTPDTFEVFNDDPFPLEKFVECSLLKKKSIKSEQNRRNSYGNEGRIAGRITPSLAPADNMGGVMYRKIYGGYDGGVEAGFEGVWRKTEFADLCEKLSIAKQAA
ncbi:MAG: hypothetical protein LBU34_10540, partial [Planctomycetaceae bacterium]|nr:hypothetical protein [Planctomycetaceae bacterium]